MPTTVGNIPIRRTAHEALLQLSAEDQAQVLEALAALSGVPWREWPGDRLKKLPDRSAYIFVIDVVRKDTLTAFAAP